MYTLYGFKGSGSAAVEMALAVAELPHRVVSAASWEPNSAIDELRGVNPLAQIPTLVLPDGSVMTESAAILVHLGLQAAPGVLLPADASARAQAIRGLVFIAANCYSAISIIDFPERWTTDTSEASRPAIKAGTRDRLHQHWAIFADTFKGTPFLSGERPGALDLLAAVVSKWSGARAHLESQRPFFHQTLRRIECDDALAPLFARHWEPKPRRPENKYPRYHAHLYFGPDTLEQARSLAQEAADRFGMQMGRVHQQPVGPHLPWSCQLAFEAAAFDALVPWLDANRGALDVFVHPLTGDEMADHTVHAAWLGKEWPLELAALDPPGA